MFGDKGVKIVKPEEGYPVRPDDFEIDEGDDEFEEYDENVIRWINFSLPSTFTQLNLSYSKYLLKFKQI